MKQVYNFDKITNEYLGVCDARLDPLESKKRKKDIYLLPGFATFIEPPQPQDGKIPVFKQGKWIKRTDLRGTVHYDEFGNPQVILEIGKRIPGRNTTEKPTKGIRKPHWDGAKWEEGALVFRGKNADTKKRLRRVVRNLIIDCGEERAKTLKLIAGRGECPEWDQFLIARQDILQASNAYKNKHDLPIE